jgi:hypothetical protein
MVTQFMLKCLWYHLNYTLDVCRATDGSNVTEINVDILYVGDSLFCYSVLSCLIKF